MIGRPMPDVRTPRRRLYAVLAVAHAGMLAFFLVDRASGTASAVTGFPLDDAWIHLVYARSLAHGDGFAYNPGQLETGFTSPLWVMLLAPLFWIFRGIGLVLAVKA